jgi:hypothetical protein
MIHLTPPAKLAREALQELEEQLRVVILARTARAPPGGTGYNRGGRPDCGKRGSSPSTEHGNTRTSVGAARPDGPFRAERTVEWRTDST